VPVVIARICKVWSSGWIAALVACVAYMAAADMPPPTSATGASDIPRTLPVSDYALAVSSKRASAYLPPASAPLNRVPLISMVHS
jgi:hypothetical protein